MFFSLNCVSIYHFILKMMDFTYFRFSVMKNHNNSAFFTALINVFWNLLKGYLNLEVEEVLRNDGKKQQISV